MSGTVQVRLNDSLLRLNHRYSAFKRLQLNLQFMARSALSGTNDTRTCPCVRQKLFCQGG